MCRSHASSRAANVTVQPSAGQPATATPNGAGERLPSKLDCSVLAVANTEQVTCDDLLARCRGPLLRSQEGWQAPRDDLLGLGGDRPHEVGSGRDAVDEARDLAGADGALVGVA